MERLKPDMHGFQVRPEEEDNIINKLWRLHYCKLRTSSSSKWHSSKKLSGFIAWPLLTTLRQKRARSWGCSYFLLIGSVEKTHTRSQWCRADVIRPPMAISTEILAFYRGLSLACASLVTVTKVCAMGIRLDRDGRRLQLKWSNDTFPPANRLAAITSQAYVYSKIPCQVVVDENSKEFASHRTSQ